MSRQELYRYRFTDGSEHYSPIRLQGIGSILEEEVAFRQVLPGDEDPDDLRKRHMKLLFEQQSRGDQTDGILRERDDAIRAAGELEDDCSFLAESRSQLVNAVNQVHNLMDAAWNRSSDSITREEVHYWGKLLREAVIKCL